MPQTHGINVFQQSTSISTPSVAATGIPFVIGTAPFGDETTGTAGVPVLATSYDEAVAAIGYDADWKTYTLCEVMYYHFRLAACQPVIFLPLEKEADNTTVAASVESVELCLTMFGLVPDLILAPGFSDEPTVAAVLAAKASAINGMFKAKTIVDIKADTYTAAIQKKNDGTFDENMIVCWPMVKLGDLVFHLSTVMAGRIAQTDTDNGGVPYESPSNKSIHADSLYNGSNTVLLTHSQANMLDEAGICTALNFMGAFTAWGNNTGCYPTVRDVKDYFIPVSRMFGWVGNTLIKTFWSYLDQPMTPILVDSILDSANLWIDGLTGSGYLLGGRVEMIEAENPVSNLTAGIIKLHIYLTPPSPAKQIDFVLEYHADYVSAAFEGE